MTENIRDTGRFHIIKKTNGGQITISKILANKIDFSNKEKILIKINDDNNDNNDNNDSIIISKLNKND